MPLGRNCQSLAVLVFQLFGISCFRHRFECLDTIMDHVDFIVYVRIDCPEALSTVHSKRDEWRDDLSLLLTLGFNGAQVEGRP